MGLRQSLRDLGKTATQHEADEIRAATAGQADVTGPIEDRRIGQVCGVVRSVTMPPRASVPVLVAEVFDGTTAVNLVWIGRRRIAGIEPGAMLSARGRVAMKRGIPTIFNPPYALLPRS